MSEDDLLEALVDDPESLDQASWERALAMAAADPARLRLQLRMDELLSRAIDPMRADLLSSIRYRQDHPIASARFASRVMRHRRLRWRPSRWQLATAALLVVLVGGWLWMEASKPLPPAVICHLEGGEGRVLREGSSEIGTTGTPLHAGDKVTASADGSTVRYDDGTGFWLARDSRLRVLPADAFAGKRATLEHGSLDAEVAAQPPGRPLVILTPQAELTVIGTAFHLASDEQRTRLEVTHGRVRMARRSDHTAIEVSAGESAVAAADIALRVAPTASSTVLFDQDFEDAVLEPGSIGTVVPGPARPNNGACVAGRDIPESRTTRVRIMDATAGLFHYQEGAELSFDYWVDDRVGGIGVYVWDRTLQTNLGGYECSLAELRHGQWTRMVVALAALHAGAVHLQPGDLITEINMVTGPHQGALFIDNVHVALRTAP
jgi:hypothetical protein